MHPRATGTGKMTSAPYQRSLLQTLAGTAAFGLLLWLVASPRWFSFFGLATMLLAAALPLSYLLWQRLPVIDWRRWWVLLFAVPALLLALTQIGYWLAYFSYGPTNPALGIVRGMIHMHAGPYLPLAGVLVAAAWAWLFWRTALERP